MIKYEIWYTFKKDREYKSFQRKSEAIKFVRTMKKRGATNIFLDKMNCSEQGDDLIECKQY